MTEIRPSDALLQYMGRIDFSVPDAPEFFWAGSLVQFSFTGDKLCAVIENHRIYNGLQLGCIVDGKAYQLGLSAENDVPHTYVVPVPGKGVHTCTIYKRQDATHSFRLRGILLADGEKLCPLPPLPALKLEFFGDSVTAGSVAEALECIAAPDPPENDSFYDNAWDSYAMQTARLLGAQVHLTAQGGIALFDRSGYYACGEYGMETVYDKLCYFPDRPMTQWDFSRYIPDYVIIAIGQNDGHYDEKDQLLSPERRERWLDAYCEMTGRLAALYPEAVFILTLTVLMHDPFWERLLDEACARMNSPRVKRFRFTRSGAATPGHPRIPEHCEMACELTEYILSLRAAQSRDTAGRQPCK